MKQKIIETKLMLPTMGEITIKLSDNGDYYVAKWKDGHYDLKDVITECKEIIEALEDFTKEVLTK